MRQYRGNRVAQGNTTGEAGISSLSGRYEPPSNVPVSGNRQGEKCLSQSEDPCLRLCQSEEFDARDATYSRRWCPAICCMGAIRSKAEEHRHHDLIRFLDTISDTEHQDYNSNYKCDDLPQIVAEGRSHSTKRCGEGIDIARGKRASGKCSDHVFQNPSHDDGIPNRHRKRTKHRDKTERFADLAFATGFSCGTKGVNRTGSCASSEAHLPDDTGRCNQYNKDKIRDKVGTASI